MRDKFEKNENLNISSEKIELLKTHFPGCFTKHGELDFKSLEAELRSEVDIVKEGYSLNWLGKSYARVIASMETETVISPDIVHNSLDENKSSRNAYIKGDNLDVLKHLVNAYRGEIKMIYIDPPYNTGSDEFVYEDNFNFTPEQLAKLAKVELDEAQRILDFTTRKSNSHSAWLTFMYPRLFVARELLTDDGVIFISIDDNEQVNLKLLCDDIFGEENFIANFIWEKRTNRENRKLVSSRHDYILCYCRKKSQETKAIKQIPMSERALSDYKNPDNDPRGLWKSDPATAQAGHGTKSQFYVLTAPNGKKHTLPSGRCWLYTEGVMNEAIKDGRIWFGRDGNGVPRVKTYLDAKERGLTPESIWFATDVSTNEIAKNKLKELFDDKSVFETPKPVDLIKLAIQLTSETDDIILDFFSGSATTAQAVLEQNAFDKGKRKYILVQIPEKTKDDSEAFKNGFNNITEIGIERIKRASRQVKNETNADIDYGFKIYETKPVPENSLTKMLNFTGTMISDNTLLEEFGKETVLITWMLEDGHPITMNYESVDLGNGYIAYKVDNTMYLLDGDFTIDEHLKTLIEKLDSEESFIINKLVLFGYSFATQTIASITDNMKHLRNGRKSADIHVEVRY